MSKGKKKDIGEIEIILDKKWRDMRNEKRIIENLKENMRLGNRRKKVGKKKKKMEKRWKRMDKVESIGEIKSEGSRK